MAEELARLIERARRIEMTPEQKQQQRISFAYGNTKIENDSITWDTVKKAEEELSKNSR